MDTMSVNGGYTYRERIDPRHAGTALAAYLAARFPHTPRAAWIERIRGGLVRLDGATVDPGAPLAAGQRLSWERPGWIEPAVPLGFAVLYDDGDVVAVAKPAGLPTLPGGGYLEHTLLSRLARYRAGLRPLHRLGRHTSGIVLCAASRDARGRLSRAWNGGAVRKRYRALAAGAPARDDFEIDVPIGPVPYAPLGTLHAASAPGKPALSRVSVVERRDGVFLCDVEIASGRPHQIRIHLAAAGHPLAGDPLYAAGGVPRAEGRALPGDGGYALHAMELSFPGATVRCAPPPSLRADRVAG